MFEAMSEADAYQSIKNGITKALERMEKSEEIKNELPSPETITRLRQEKCTVDKDLEEALRLIESNDGIINNVLPVRTKKATIEGVDVEFIVSFHPHLSPYSGTLKAVLTHTILGQIEITSRGFNVLSSGSLKYTEQAVLDQVVYFIKRYKEANKELYIQGYK